ncbi:hypothetical protein ACIQ1D_18605 [Lysinibacillus xylanilyticus]|uniref:N-acetyltransferase domain-containing protein n=1 Tax=Lysinibacillus xylanilyticus TaxID=582475 RepID=A0A2M9Q5Q6_9BACI|nr:hypothetical protein [Lysinibacillus xylanilyticus]PJO43411.1 hypothetical protein CWD94_12745 [Lysinibacillus xylanilyticus]
MTANNSPMKHNIKNFIFEKVVNEKQLNQTSVFGSEWKYALKESCIIWKIKCSVSLVTMGMVALEVAPNHQYLNIILLETFEEYRNKDIGKVLIAFSYLLSKNFTDEVFKLESSKVTQNPQYLLTVESKPNARSYYSQKIGAKSSTEVYDIFIINAKLGNTLINNYLK